MSTLTWITEKVLQREREMQNKGLDVRWKTTRKVSSGGEKMRNASSQQGENEQQ